MEIHAPRRLAGNLFSSAGTLIGKIFLVCFIVCSSFAQPSPAGLRLTVSNDTTTVFWPLRDYYSLLQSAPDFMYPNGWTNVAGAAAPTTTLSFFGPGLYGSAALATNVVGNEFSYTLPRSGNQKYFRLHSPHYFFPTSFAVFYDGTLEFSQAATMIVNGLVYARGPIDVGTSASLTFNQPVTTTSTVSGAANDGLGPWTPDGTTNNWNTVFNGSPTLITNAPDLLSAIGTNKLHTMIEVPSPQNTNGLIKFYDLAYMVLLVTNIPGTITNFNVQLKILASVNNQLPGNDPAPVVLVYTNSNPPDLPFLSLTNLTYDQRERKTNLITQIDIGIFARWIATNTTVQAKLPSILGQFPSLLYVADQRQVTPTQLASVRLMNAAQLPENNGLGFSVATMNPLYVWGNYNVQTANSVANASAGTTNVAFSVPAALISDSLTILSAAWTDDQGFSTYNSFTTAFDATTTTINAAILTGTVPSTGNDAASFSGGIHNLPRLLEDWSGQSLWLNTSLVRLWDSQMATNQFRNPPAFSPAPVNPYYNPPTRHFSFDARYQGPAFTPPGIPVFIIDWK